MIHTARYKHVRLIICVGPNDDGLGPCFPAIDDKLRKVTLHAANQLNIYILHPHGIYCFVSGLMYESKADMSFITMLGGACVGMSTIPEVVAAHHCIMKTLCLS